MGAFKIDTFGGMTPAVDDRLGPDKGSVYIRDAWLYSGALIGQPEPELLKTLSVGTAKVFRLPNNYTDSIHLLDSDWLEFSDPFTDVVRGPTVGDTYDRYYWASSSTTPKYNTRARIKAGSDAYTLGIPAPSTAPGVTATGGVSTAVSRAYVYTWVSSYGEEGPPSPPTVVNGKVDSTWAITMTAPGSGDTTGRALDKVRIYRTVTSSSGVATYFFVKELAIATTSYTDAYTDTQVSLNNELQSTNWTAPPTDLQGVVAMPNGMIAGWRDNELWFCEPFYPHAWPALYAVVTEWPIVGLAVNGTALAIMTEGNPYIATGNHPSAITLSKMPVLAPCVSRGSIVTAQDGVRYASINGLVLISQGAVSNSTQGVLSSNKWRALPEVPTLRAALVGSAYVGFGSSREGMFETTSFDTSIFAQTDYTGAYDGIFFDLADARVGYSALTTTEPITNLTTDVWSGETFIIKDNKLYWYNIGNATPMRQVYLWRSKVFQMSFVKNFGAMKIYFNVPVGTPTQNPVRNTDLVQTLQDDQYGLVRLYVDGELVLTREIRTSGEFMRMPSGFKGSYFQWELEARVEVYSIQAGTTAKELKGA